MKAGKHLAWWHLTHEEEPLQNPVTRETQDEVQHNKETNYWAAAKLQDHFYLMDEEFEGRRKMKPNVFKMLVLSWQNESRWTGPLPRFWDHPSSAAALFLLLPAESSWWSNCIKFHCDLILSEQQGHTQGPLEPCLSFLFFMQKRFHHIQGSRSFSLLCRFWLILH